MAQRAGRRRRRLSLEIVGAAINMADAVTMKHIADSEKFTEGLSTMMDGVVDVPECEHLGEAIGCGEGAASYGENRIIGPWTPRRADSGWGCDGKPQ